MGARPQAVKAEHNLQDYNLSPKAALGVTIRSGEQTMSLTTSIQVGLEKAQLALQY